MLNDISLVWVAQNHENKAFWKWKDKFNRPEIIVCIRTIEFLNIFLRGATIESISETFKHDYGKKLVSITCYNISSFLQV